MAGVSIMLTTPIADSTANHSIMIGPKRRPRPLVPLLCTRYSAIRITTVIGTIYGLNAGVASSMPSTADKTEIAGVMTPSPKNSEAPMTPTTVSGMIHCGRSFTDTSANANKAMMPPSPRLSARKIRVTYLSETMIVKPQMINDTTPRMLAVSSGTPPLCLEKTSLRAYSGLVPISP